MLIYFDYLYLRNVGPFYIIHQCPETLIQPRGDDIFSPVYDGPMFIFALGLLRGFHFARPGGTAVSFDKGCWTAVSLGTMPDDSKAQRRHAGVTCRRGLPYPRCCHTSARARTGVGVGTSDRSLGLFPEAWHASVAARAPAAAAHVWAPACVARRNGRAACVRANVSHANA